MGLHWFILMNVAPEASPRTEKVVAQVEARLKELRVGNKKILAAE